MASLTLGDVSTVRVDLSFKQRTLRLTSGWGCTTAAHWHPCEREASVVGFAHEGLAVNNEVPRNLLALSSFGFSKAHFGFSFRCAASDYLSILLATSDQALMFFVNLPMYPSASFFFQKSESCESSPRI